MKKRPAGCFQVLCNEIIPLEGKYYFEVYLEKISFGIFSIGVCSLKRRGF
jgi:hypothetical protein